MIGEFDVVIVGSGPAGAMAALGLAGLKVLVVDAGKTGPDTSALSRNLYEHRREDPSQFDWLIGRSFESLGNIEGEYSNLKLKAPFARFVREDVARHQPHATESFLAMTSLARGGLANAWGANVHRYGERDLRGFPVTAAELTPLYEEVEREIGYSGGDDDVSQDLGGARDANPPLRLSPGAGRLLARYEKARERFQRAGVRLGRARLAILTRERDGRAPFRYQSDEFWRTDDPAIYSPGHTIDRLLARREIEYLGGHLVESFEVEGSSRATSAGGDPRSPGAIRIRARRLVDGASVEIRARSLLLAAGALGSARIALRSLASPTDRVPLLDNPMSYIPLLDLGLLGSPHPRDAFGLAQLNLLVDGSPELIGGVYQYTSGLRADLALDFPLAAPDALAAAKYAIPAMVMIQFLYPCDPHPANTARLRADGKLEIAWGWTPERGRAERRLIRELWRSGYVTAPFLCQFPPAGSSIHYAGTLPYSEEPRPLTVDRFGELRGAPGVFVADASVFPRLPHKNLTLTIMAGALRSARAARHRIEG